jgi:hypothetical protein
MEQLLMPVEEVLVVMGLRLLPVVTMERSVRLGIVMRMWRVGGMNMPHDQEVQADGIKHELRQMELMKETVKMRWWFD